jgi:O-antigen/teichoic acid export membrane protein
MIALSAQVAISLISIPYIGGLGASIAKASSYIMLFLIPAYALKQSTGLHYDKRALKIGLSGSIIMSWIIFAINSYLVHPYYLPISLSIGILSYLLFLRYAKIVNIKDIEIIDKILFGKAGWLMAAIAKVVIK